jgi:hypothetical protein
MVQQIEKRHFALVEAVACSTNGAANPTEAFAEAAHFLGKPASVPARADEGLGRNPWPDSRFDVIAQTALCNHRFRDADASGIADSK